jgi:chitosanase
MSITPQQKHVIDCVLSIFETGRIPTTASYSTCSILDDGAGISYGKHQCTDKAGSLDLVCKKYIELGGQQSEPLKQYMNYLATSESSKFGSKRESYPTWLVSLINLLKSAGSDVKMQQAQDEVFDKVYWLPAVNHANNIGLKTALGHLIVYDSTIHSGANGVTIIRNLFPQKSPVNGGDEKQWCLAYINARRNWLLSNPNNLVKKTTYRMDALKAIADSDNWDLTTPLTVRNVRIT